MFGSCWLLAIGLPVVAWYHRRGYFVVVVVVASARERRRRRLLTVQDACMKMHEDYYISGMVHIDVDRPADVSYI